MVGVMLKLLSDFIEKNWGSEGLQEAKIQAGIPVDQQFRLDTHYSDEQWQALFAAGVHVSGLPSDEMEWIFARYCGEDLSLRFRGFFKGAKTTRDMIVRQPQIHNFIAASISDPATRKSVTDKFRLEEFDEETVVHYVSPNKNCILYKGLAQWVADRFNEEIVINEASCLKQGDKECEIHIQYPTQKNGESESDNR